MMTLSLLVGCAQAPATRAMPAVIEPPSLHPQEKKRTVNPDAAIRSKQDEIGRKLEDTLRQLNAPLRPPDDDCP